MPDLVLFTEDFAHEEFLRTLIGRVARELGVDKPRIHPRSVRGGHGRMLTELKAYLRELEGGGAPPETLVVARDANCKGFQACRNELEGAVPAAFRDFTIYAVPDPHIERWLLLDSAAFKAVLGKGCSAPKYKCAKERYKQFLLDAIRQSGVSPILGGVEHTEDIVQALNLHRLEKADRAFGKLLKDLRIQLRRS